jgi:hypothetical protein
VRFAFNRANPTSVLAFTFAISVSLRWLSSAVFLCVYTVIAMEKTATNSENKPAIQAASIFGSMIQLRGSLDDVVVEPVLTVLFGLPDLHHPPPASRIGPAIMADEPLGPRLRSVILSAISQQANPGKSA